MARHCLASAKAPRHCGLWERGSSPRKGAPGDGAKAGLRQEVQLYTSSCVGAGKRRRTGCRLEAQGCAHRKKSRSVTRKEKGAHQEAHGGCGLGIRRSYLGSRHSAAPKLGAQPAGARDCAALARSLPSLVPSATRVILVLLALFPWECIPAARSSLIHLARHTIDTSLGDDFTPYHARKEYHLRSQGHREILQAQVHTFGRRSEPVALGRGPRLGGSGEKWFSPLPSVAAGLPRRNSSIHARRSLGEYARGKPQSPASPVCQGANFSIASHQDIGGTTLPLGLALLPRLYLVQLSSSTSAERLFRTAAALGALVLQYLPDRAYLVLLPCAKTAEQLREFSGVSWVHHFRAEYKVSPLWDSPQRSVQSIHAPSLSVLV